jgi:hypothetical protein
MKKLVLLALAAAALAVPAAPASASCLPTAALGGNSVGVCNRRIWEKQQYYATVCTDKNLDNQPEACKEYKIIEFYG